jgi:hypothetical protein
MKQQFMAVAAALTLAGAAKSETASARHAAHVKDCLAEQAMRLAIGAHLKTPQQFDRFFAVVPAMSTCDDPQWRALLCSEEFLFKDGSTFGDLFVRVRNTYQLRPHAPFDVAKPP